MIQLRKKFEKRQSEYPTSTIKTTPGY